MEPSRLHELNKLAGEFCGKKLTGQFSHGGERWVYASYEDECTMQYTPWNPCENHNQAAEVKATLSDILAAATGRSAYRESREKLSFDWATTAAAEA